MSERAEKRARGALEFWVALTLAALSLAVAAPMFAATSSPEAQVPPPGTAQAGGAAAEVGAALPAEPFPRLDVDAWAALSAAPGLDLRDASNRAVSRSALGRAYRAGTLALLLQAAAASPLKAKAGLVAYLERAAPLISSLRRPFCRLFRGLALAAAPARSPKVRVPAGRAEARPAAHGGLAASGRSAFPFLPGRVRVLVLRC